MTAGPDTLRILRGIALGAGQTMDALCDAITQLRNDGYTVWEELSSDDIERLACELLNQGHAITTHQQLWSTAQAADYLNIRSESVRKKLTRAGIDYVDRRGWPADEIRYHWPKEVPTDVQEDQPGITTGR